MNGHAFFGRVLTRVPDRKQGSALLDALTTVSATPGFAALQRPARVHPSPTSPRTTTEALPRPAGGLQAAQATALIALEGCCTGSPAPAQSRGPQSWSQAGYALTCC
ncbi:hypothetical protein [Nocardia vinacea]|uniref:hypothetical protein n=1 Tax=Nocardia vinacea TaxID=96468 RepID=UPI003F4CB95E